jgi:hypothetical protein
MQKRLLIAALLVVVTPIFATEGEADLRAADTAVCHAIEEGDADEVERMVDPGFTLISTSGDVQTRAQLLDEVTKREPRYAEFRNHDEALRRYGDAAVINGITTVRGAAGGQAFAADFRFTDTWVRRDGHWILVASHATRLPSADGSH